MVGQTGEPEGSFQVPGGQEVVCCCEEAFTLKEKMKSLMEGLDTVKGEVVEEKEGLTLLSIPCIQEKLETKELSVPTVSRRQALLDKLRNKKLIPK